jgi:hypothetical protein
MSLLFADVALADLRSQRAQPLAEWFARKKLSRGSAKCAWGLTREARPLLCFGTRRHVMSTTAWVVVVVLAILLFGGGGFFYSRR